MTESIGMRNYRSWPSAVHRSRKRLWLVGIAVAGIILGACSSGNSGDAAATLGHKLYQENADVGIAENTCTTQADEQNAMTVTAFVNDCINAYVNGGGTTRNKGTTGDSGATGASGASGTGGTGNTGNTTTTAPPTTTFPPTTTPPTTAPPTTTLPPTTTTTISPQAAYQAGYGAGQATFKGDSPSQLQTYCMGTLTSFAPASISQSPALSAQYMAGCEAGEEAGG